MQKKKKYPWRKAVMVLIVMFNTGVLSLRAQELCQERQYEPVVLRGAILSQFYEVPVKEIFMYAYRDSSQTWTMMPFQIDERVNAEDPFHPGNEAMRKDFYLWEDNGVLDFRDELVFMVRDLGDKAEQDNWIDDEASKEFSRLEIKVRDPLYPERCAYGYLYRSATIADEIPTPYELDYDPENQIAGSKYFSVRLNRENGMVQDIVIKPPFGSGIDIFDTQKLRFVGVFDLGILTIPIGKYGQPAANERDNLYVYNEHDTDNYYLAYSPKPVVRLIREVRQTIRFGDFKIDETAFYVVTKFYPFSGELVGGASLDPEKLKREFGTEEDIYVQLDLLRQSWDFNAAAIGMKFFNQANGEIIIDGVPDQVDKTIKTPVKEWALTTGDQGSLFTHVVFNDTNWQDIELYYFDNKLGGQGDGTSIYGGDTGDSVSYGDHGIVFYNSNQDSTNLKLSFTAYFLPGNLQKEDGELLAAQVENPVICSATAESFATGVEVTRGASVPKECCLFQNYPNPFNSLTKITFSIPTTERVNLTIRDVHGRRVKKLLDDELSPGMYEIIWDGRAGHHQEVSSGVYFVKFRVKQQTQTKKLILLR